MWTYGKWSSWACHRISSRVAHPYWWCKDSDSDPQMYSFSTQKIADLQTCIIHFTWPVGHPTYGVHGVSLSSCPDDTLQLRRPGDVASEKAPAAEQKPLDIGFGELNQPSHTMPEPVRAHYIPSKPEVPAGPDSLPTVCSFRQCVSRKTCAVVRKVPGWCSWSDSKRVQSWACLKVFQGFYSHISFSDIFSPDSSYVTHLRIPFWLWLPPAECEFNHTAAPYCAGCLKQYSFKGLRLASPSLALS